MNYTYSLIYNSPSVLRSDGATIPADLGNTDWRQYQDWLAQGNTPTPVPLDIYKNNQRGKISSACSSTHLKAGTCDVPPPPCGVNSRLSPWLMMSTLTTGMS